MRVGGLLWWEDLVLELPSDDGQRNRACHEVTRWHASGGKAGEHTPTERQHTLQRPEAKAGGPRIPHKRRRGRCRLPRAP